MLGRKQHIKNSEWLGVLKDIERICSRAEIDRLAANAVSEIRERCQGKQAAYSWSGGKDSLVLGDLCEQAGVKQCFIVICDLEYPAFLQWVTDHMPNELEVINTGQNLTWLAQHQDMLFPQDAATAAKWFHIVQHTGQARYYKEHHLDLILLGRRKADGNFVGRGGQHIYTNAQGVTRYSPLSDWTHEQILAYIHYHQLALPPFYGWKNGYYCGTHPWAARQWTGNIQNGWSEVYDIDKSIVEQAAGFIPSAKVFLNSI